MASELFIRPAAPEELPRLMEIYAAARAFMRESGNPGQWGTSDPKEELIARDIAAGNSYVFTEEGEIVGAFSFTEGCDPTYGYIEGAWLSDEPYCTIHRLAGDGRAHGLFSAALAFCAERCKNLRADTHEKNAVMRHLLIKHGFRECGVIYVENGTPRIAYQRLF